MYICVFFPGEEFNIKAGLHLFPKIAAQHVQAHGLIVKVKDPNIRYLPASLAGA